MLTKLSVVIMSKYMRAKACWFAVVVCSDVYHYFPIKLGEKRRHPSRCKVSIVFFLSGIENKCDKMLSFDPAGRGQCVNL